MPRTLAARSISTFENEGTAGGVLPHWCSCKKKGSDLATRDCRWAIPLRQTKDAAKGDAARARFLGRIWKRLDEYVGLHDSTDPDRHYSQFIDKGLKTHILQTGL